MTHASGIATLALGLIVAMAAPRAGHAQAGQSLGTQGALDGARHRVIVSTDIGGTDPDDFQSMVHLLLYADVLDIEGLVSSPYGPGRATHIHEVIDRYARDYPNLRSHSPRYPTPDALRAITKQGETDVAPRAGIRRTTEGSAWIVARARANDPRPLHVLVWGGLEDLAQALHDAPDILPRLRVHFIGGPNKKWSPDAYQYIATHHPDLWFIENNSTYRGWFSGGDQGADLGNESFVLRHVAGHGALGDYFATMLEGFIKMGDTPTLAWLLKGTPADPTQPSWGGRYLRAWVRPQASFTRLTTATDRLEQFGILDLALPVPAGTPASAMATMVIENQSLVGEVGDGMMRFRFSPKEAKTYSYTIRSAVAELDGLRGQLTSVAAPPDAATRPDRRLRHWWTDDPALDVAEGDLQGARTVNAWRRAWLDDFAVRLRRAKAPLP
jgi:hypothetical protein